MYIPYSKIGLTLRHLFPQYGYRLAEIFENLRIRQNVDYIKSNKKKVLARLRNKKEFRVAFLCSEPSKWKCQTLFDLMQENEHFEPFILATKAGSKVQNAENAIETYEFFKSKNMLVKYAYDIDKETFLHSKDFNVDIIFYQQPWVNETTQGPVMASKYALTYYVPYFLATSESWIEYGLRFHEYIQKHYVLNKIILEDFSKKMKNCGKNLKIAGNPQLDYFYLNKDKKFEKKYVIYAPHHSINDNRTNWSTFAWSGQFMLEYAQKHPEINWIFKPHPYLKTVLKNQKHMSDEEINNYWSEWSKVAEVCESGDYLDLFMQSYAMITDCGSFLTEYLLTGNPLIHLSREDGVPFNKSVQKIVDSYYKADNKETLEELLEKVVIQRQDCMKEKREQVLRELDFVDNYAAKNILDDIKKDLGIND